MNMDFEIASKISDIETIAVGRKIRELPILQKRFGEDVGVSSKVLPP